MRQDSMRSSVYRSFVTCDDPKGVIECGTIRKSKFCSKKLKEEEEETLGKKKNQKQEEDGEDDDDERLRRRRSSSLQLNEVAREALKLNRMADSYSNRSSFDGNSKDVAKDLLKGALDLQESLIMLGKLQESSTKMAKLKKKKEHNDQILGFQKQRLSVHNGYYSKDCFDELREAIKEGLAKQNLLLRRRNLDMASTSSTTHSSSSSTSMIENSQTRLPGNPNLIAKLMGLDHIPARTNSYKQQVKKFEDAQPPPIVIIKPARFLNPDCDTKEMMKISDLYTKQMIKTDQKPVKRLKQDLGLKNMRRTRFKHQEDSFKPKASAGVPKKTKEERTQRRRNKPEENTKSVAAISKSNVKTNKDRIVQIAPTPRFQNSQHKRRNPPQNNDNPTKAIEREVDENELTTPKEIVKILNITDQKDNNQSENSEEKTKIDTKGMLLSSPLFIAYAKELFNVVVGDTKLPSNTTIVDSGSENDRRLIIDYAKELMEEKYLKRIDTSSVTLEQLVDEVCNEIGKCNDQLMKENAGAGAAADGGLDAVIIRSWDLGRREMDMIVGEIEKMISRELVDSLMIEFQI